MEKEKCLYTCKNIVDSNEYKKMAKYFPKRMYWVFVNRGLFLNLILSAIIAIVTQSLSSVLIFFIIYQLSLMIIYKVRLEHYAEKVFNEREKQGIIDTEFETQFYDDYLIRKGETSSLTIKYSDISKCVETNTNFYLEYPQRNIIIILKKSSCNSELIEFIRKTFENTQTKICNNPNSKKANNPNVIKTLMTILFIATIATLWLGLYSQGILNKYFPKYGFSFTENYWIFWCLLPIPILSIILGYKYKKEGFECKKNIVAGYIIGVLLIIYGSFCMFPTHEQDYTKINGYKEIINLELPNNGVLEVIDWDSHPYRNMTEYTTINAYYAQVDVTELVESIENNSNWILSKEFRTDMNIFLTSSLVPDTDAYFSIYNKTTNEYNVLPEKSGVYEIYAMKYDKSDKKLQIDKFKISYNK